MMEKNERYQKRDWVQWCGRILKTDSQRLMKLSKILIRKGKIQKHNRNTILRFALLSLLHTLEKYEVKEKKELQTKELKELSKQQQQVEERRMAILDTKREEELAIIQAENDVFIKQQQEKIAAIEDENHV